MSTNIELGEALITVLQLAQRLVTLDQGLGFDVAKEQAACDVVGKFLVDHFGVRNPADGLSQPGFAEVLAMGREGKAAVKLSAPFRLSRRPQDFADFYS